MKQRGECLDVDEFMMVRCMGLNVWSAKAKLLVVTLKEYSDTGIAF